MRIFFIFSLLSLGSCAMLDKPYVGNTEKEEVFESGKSASVAFDDSLVFFAKYMNDSNSAIKVKERESGQLVVRVSSPCAITWLLGQTLHEPLRYVAEIRLKENKAKLKLSVDPQIDVSGYNGGSSRMRLPASEDQEKNVNSCLKTLFEEIKEGVKKKNKTW